MQSNRTHQSLLAILLLTVSIISVTPLTHAVQPATNPITINATGSATAIGNGPSGPTTLNLKAMSYRDQNHWLIVQNATGTLTIGSSTFAIFNGQGSVNSFGDVAIFANTNASSSQSELILHGTMTESKINFDSPSQLVSSANLSLSGTIDQGNAQGPSLVTGSMSASAANASLSVTTSTNATATNSTKLTSTSLVPQNSTQTAAGNVTTVSTNSTVASTLISSNATSTSALIANGNAPNNALTTGAVTVTVTQYANQTISTTQTVASVTITYTTTVTVANATITQGNVTTTVTATTGT